MPDITSFPIPTQDFDVAAFADCQFSVPTAAALVGLVASAGNRALVLDTMRQWRFDSVTWWDEGKSPVGLLKDAVSLAQAASAVIVGSWDASSGAFPLTRPDGSGIRVGDTWAVAVSGTTGGEFFEAGDYLQALKAGGSPVFAGSWARSATGQIKKWRDEAHRWATENEDVPVETSPDQFSAKHHARKAAASAASAALYDGPWLDDVAALLADTALTYTAGQPGTVVAGDIVRTRAEGFSYEVLPLGAASPGLATAGAVLLRVLALPDGSFNFGAWAPARDGATDDRAKLLLAIDNLPVLSPDPISGGGKVAPTLVIPQGEYFISDRINLKKVVHLRGSSTGLTALNGTILKFPLNSRGIIVNRANTIDDTTEASTTGADGSIIEGIVLRSSYDGTALDRHGIWLRARAIIRDCEVRQFAGSGIYSHAQASGSGAIQGNANNFVIRDTRVVANLRHGVFIRGADANAGYGTGIDATNNGGWGICDASFLGNTWVACHTSGNGYRSDAGSPPARAYCTYEGQQYIAHPNTAHTDDTFVNTQPGTNSGVWVPTTNVSLPAGALIEWEPGLTPGIFRTGGSYASVGSNPKSQFLGCYIEGAQGRAIVSQRSLWVGGMNEYDVYGPNVMGFQSLIRQVGTRFVPPPDISTGNDYTQVQSSTGVAWRYYDGVAHTIQFGNSGSNNWYFGTSNALQRPINITKPGTAYHFGRGVAQEYKVLINELWIGGTGVNEARHITARSSLPTSGTWARGDIIFNTSASPSGKAGWVCTTTGEAGSTAVFKPFAAIDA